MGWRIASQCGSGTTDDVARQVRRSPTTGRSRSGGPTKRRVTVLARSSGPGGATLEAVAARADDGSLMQPAEYQKQVSRLMADPRADHVSGRPPDDAAWTATWSGRCG